MTDPTVEAVAQQASALSLLAAVSPDQVDASTKASAAAFGTSLLAHAKASDMDSIESILVTIARLSDQATADAAREATQSSWQARRRLDGGAASALSVAQRLVYQTDVAVQLAADLVLSASTLGQQLVRFQVSVRCCCMWSEWCDSLVC